MALLALAVVLASAMFETGAHSFHHLSDPAGAASCPVLAAAQNLQGICDGAPEPPATAVWQDAPATTAFDSPRLVPLRGAHDGRAPPRRLSS